MHDRNAGILTEKEDGGYAFNYDQAYDGPPISLRMPIEHEPYLFQRFPAFFDGLLPEGIQLTGLLKQYKIDKSDYFSQLIITGSDLVGAVTVVELEEVDE